MSQPVIDSIKDAVVVEARRRLASAAGVPAPSFLVEGHKFVGQALAARAPVEGLYFCAPIEDDAHYQLYRDARGARVPCHLLTKGVFFKLVGLGYETAVRVVATVRAQRLTPDDILQAVTPQTCIAFGERIADPRNVGVILRNCDATGTAAVFTADSADPFSRESIRSSTGSLFRVSLATAADPQSFLESLKRRGVRLYGTSARATVSLWDVRFTYPCALVFGNETHGLSDGVRDLCDDLVAIPIQGGASSFNVTVANGIILAEAARQRAGR